MICYTVNPNCRTFSILLCLERKLEAASLTTEYKNHCHRANVGSKVTIAKRGALSPSPLGGVICVTCPEFLRYIKWLESCFNWTVGIPLYVRIAGAKLPVLYLCITSCSYTRGSFPCHLSICSHSSALRQLSSGERWKGSQRLAVSSPLESCKDSSELFCVHRVCQEQWSSFPRHWELQYSLLLFVLSVTR